MPRTITINDVRINGLHIYYAADGVSLECVAEYVLLTSDGTPYGDGKSITIQLSAAQRTTLRTFAVNQLLPAIRIAEAL